MANEGSERGRVASSRTLWRLLETYHSLVYYAPERQGEYTALGLKGGWMGYFASRSAALGQTPPAVVTACLFSFAPRMVQRALPDAWRYTTPDEAGAARLRVFDQAVRRILGGALDDRRISEVADQLGDVIGELPAAGAPMFAAHAQLDVPAQPHLSLFWAATALREFRGDAHITALRASQVEPAESNALMVAMGLVPSDQQAYRGWNDEEWSEAVQSLQERGWLDREGRPTRTGQRERSRIERETDRLSETALTRMSEADVARAIGVLGPLVGQIVTAGEFPYPNGIGVAPVAELAVPR